MRADGCRAAHEPRKLLIDFRCLKHLLDGPAVSELRVWVVDGVLMVFGC